MNDFMNELFNVCYFSDEKMQDSDAFYECVTRQTDRPTDRPTDTAYYRDARTHLKRNLMETLLHIFFLNR